MRRSFFRLLSSSLILLVTIPLSAQNLMNRIYAVPLTGPIHPGDFNEDGIPDVIFSISDGVEVGMSDSRGNLSFLSSAGTSQGDAGDLAVAQFTSSGHLDAAVVHESNEGAPPNPIDILLGHGDGTFTVGSPLTLPAGAGTPVAITTSDFDDDGKVDLAALYTNKIYIFPGHGDGTFGPAKTITTTFSAGGSNAPSPPFKLLVGDFDGDGRTDFALSDSNHAAVLFNTGSFRFQQKDVTNESAFIIDFTPTDVNQDGFTDLVVSLRGDCPPGNGPCKGGYSVYLSQGRTRNFKVSYRLAPTFDEIPPFSPIVADIDGDGINDILFITAPIHPELHIAKGNPDGTYGTPRVITLSNINGGSNLVVVDLNRDGRPDFVSTNWVSGELYTSMNAYPRSTCTAGTESPSVTVCRPSDDAFSNSPLHVIAKATDTAHHVTAMQTYVDNKLKTTSKGATLDENLSLSLGTHLLSVKAWDASGNNFRSLRYVNIFKGTPGPVCMAGINTVHICFPAPNARVASPVRVFAASNPDTENSAIQVYLDHQLVFDDENANFLDHTFTLAPGSHSLTVKEWDVNGRQVSQSETIQVAQ